MRLGTMGLWIALTFAGCAGSSPAGGDDAATPNDGPGDDTAGDTDDPVAEPEAACDDEADDDGDGAIDCADSDCEAEELCTWPVTIDFETLLSFDASLVAEIAGYGDCIVHITAPLARDRAESCPGCDRVFSGPFAFPEDDCPDEIERPAEGGYGVDFRSTTSWEVFGRVNEEWTSLGVAEDDGTGTLRIADTQPIEFEGFDAGELTTRFAFTPR